MADSIIANLNQHVLTLTLGGGVAHPLSLRMIEDLHQAIRDAQTNPEAHVIVIHGPGRIFCAGHDLKEIDAHRSDPDQGRAYLTHLFEACGALMQDITNARQPTIALVEGIATAGGLQLVAACDLAYAAPQARFCLPGVQNGGFCTTPAVAVSRNLSRKHLMELALAGTPFDAEWALSAGLINRILPEDQLIDFTLKFANQIAQNNPRAIARGKETLYAHLHLPLDQAYAMATGVMVEHFMDPHRISKDADRARNAANAKKT